MEKKKTNGDNNKNERRENTGKEIYKKKLPAGDDDRDYTNGDDPDTSKEISDDPDGTQKKIPRMKD
jgi:hypothetical protein